jgi:hypothetical protein
VNAADSFDVRVGDFGGLIPDGDGKVEVFKLPDKLKNPSLFDHDIYCLGLIAFRICAAFGRFAKLADFCKSDDDTLAVFRRCLAAAPARRPKLAELLDALSVQVAGPPGRPLQIEAPVKGPEMKGEDFAGILSGMPPPDKFLVPAAVTFVARFVPPGGDDTVREKASRDMGSPDFVRADKQT